MAYMCRSCLSCSKLVTTTEVVEGGWERGGGGGWENELALMQFDIMAVCVCVCDCTSARVRVTACACMYVCACVLYNTYRIQGWQLATKAVTCVPWLIHVCAVTHANGWNEGFMCVTWHTKVVVASLSDPTVHVFIPLQHTATHCNALQYIFVARNSLLPPRMYLF